jgi:hypothetical protein
MGTGQKKFNSRLVAPTFFRKKPFGDNVEGLSHDGDESYRSKKIFKRHGLHRLLIGIDETSWLPR